jgi:2-polyprenyl-3-methyl-5-hydroxy-6-metoxy-1,4-benzoquinol methylase
MWYWGAGALLHFLTLLGYQDVSGVDASAEQVAVARALGFAEIRRGDLFEELSRLRDATREVVIAFAVLEHLTKPSCVSVAEKCTASWCQAAE